MKKIFLLAIIIFFCFFIVKLGVSTTKPIKGQVIDSATGKPLPDIIVTRIVKFRVLALDSVEIPHAVFAVKTDSDGYFYFKRRIILTPFYYLNMTDDHLNINIDLANIKEQEMIFEKFRYLKSYNVDLSDKASSKYYPIGRLSVFLRNDPEINYSNLNVINLSPRVGSMEECFGKEICEKANAYDLAMKNKDEKLCFKSDKSVFFDGIYECRRTLGIAKEDHRICDNQEICLEYLKDLKDISEKNKNSRQEYIEYKIWRGCNRFFLEESRKLCENLMKY